LKKQDTKGVLARAATMKKAVVTISYEEKLMWVVSCEKAKSYLVKEL
jgi:hypothetical protein